MKQTRYLNCILTVIAILLSAVLWVNLAGHPLLVQDATAQTLPGGIPDAGKQRKEIVDALKSLSRDVQKTNQLLEGELRTRVTNLSDLRHNDK